MIVTFHIENFKSLVDFDLPPKGVEMKKFVCLIGMNGCGKSTLLQAFDFISQMASGTLAEWLERREWKKTELLSNQTTSRKQVISFVLDVQTEPSGATVKWSARFNVSQMRCTHEEITSSEKKLLKLEEGTLFVAGAEQKDDMRYDRIPFEYTGSVLSRVNLDKSEYLLIQLRDAVRNLRSLELLSPQLMRKKARAAIDIGNGGEKLSPFLDQLPLESKKDLLKKLQEFYPQLSDWNVKGYRAGWKILKIWEKYATGASIEAGHINDGFLRVIAILSQAYAKHPVLLLDEIENGINPVLVEKLMDFLVGISGKQVIVTTHSPVILNYLDDETAKDGVILLYKTPGGETKSVRYFDLDQTSKKLCALGPGEVYVDTDLNKLVERLGREGVSNGDAI